MLDADPELVAIVWRSLLIAGSATLLALALGVPLGFALAQRRFRGRGFALGAVHTAMGMPPVVVGLVVWLLLVRSGPFGDLELAYTKTAMVIAQFLLALPMVVGFTAASIQALPACLSDLLATLGAGRVRTVLLLAREARLGLLAAVMAAFGAAVSEVGAAMTVGGNLRGSTRVLTTAIVTETSRGENDRALALGAVLLVLSFSVNAILTAIQQRRSA